MTYFLGLDIGTYQSKGVLVDSQGAVIAQAARDHKMLVPKPGWAEHRAEEDWWADFTQITRELLQTSNVLAVDIAAVACSAIGPCMLPVDGAGRPQINAVLYGVDNRAAAAVDELTARIGEDVILDRCGNALTSQAVGPKILWFARNHPDLFAQTSKILTSTSYITWKLTGDYVIDHYTAANFAPLYDVDRLDWVNDLADDICPLSMLPRLCWSTEIAGQVTEAAARETGLAEGTPVTVGTIDAAAEALSVGVTGVGDMMIMYGSTIFIITLTDDRVRDPRLWYAPWLFQGQHASMAGCATSGTLTHWFRDQFARELGDDAFPVLAAEAATSPPGANGLLVLPYFSGERTPIHDPDAKGAIFGLNLTHTRGDIYRALIEGIAFGTNHIIETYAEVGQRPTRLLAVGGGVKNRVWLGATSDISGLDQIVCDKTVGASYGDAFLAAMAVGAAEPGDIARWNPVAEQVTPAPDAAYAQPYGLWKEIYLSTKGIAKALG